jgi:hypothetical protein
MPRSAQTSSRSELESRLATRGRRGSAGRVVAAKPGPDRFHPSMVPTGAPRTGDKKAGSHVISDRNRRRFVPVSLSASRGAREAISDR